MEKQAEEMPLFTKMIDGNNFEYKIVNFENPKVCQQTGIILIEALKRSQIKQPRISFSRVTDPETGVVFGIPLGTEKETGELKFDRIVLTDMMQFDLSIPRDRKLWCVISHHPCMMGSPFQSGTPKYKQIDKDKEANKIIRMSKARRRASEIAENMIGAELYDMATNLGVSSEHNNLNTLLAAVIEKAEKEPNEFLDIYDNANRNVLTAFNRARATGLITLDVTNGYMWKDTYALGSTEAMAVKKLIENPTLLMNMDLESKQRSQFFKQHATEEQKQPIQLNPGQGETARNQEQKDKGFVLDKDLDEKLNKLDKLTKEVEEEKVKTKALNDKLEAFLESNKKPEMVESVVNLHDYSLEKLQNMAFEIGFALAKTTTNKKLLIQKIEDHKKGK